MVDNEEGEVSQISKLQMEIEQKNNVLLQLKAELEKQNDYQLLQEQYRYRYQEEYESWIFIAYVR